MARVNWIEIGVLDLDRAIEFYRNTFAMEITKTRLEDTQHGVFRLRDEMGGVLHLVEKVENGIAIYFHVDRISEVIALAVQHGGEVIINKTLLKAYNAEADNVIAKTMFDGKIGYFAKIKDTEGNILGLHSNA